MTRRLPRRPDLTGARRLMIPESWTTEGLCVVEPTRAGAAEVWEAFDEPTATPERLAAVREICSWCLVRAQCRDYGLYGDDTTGFEPPEYGMFGGLTPVERDARRRGDERAHEAIMREVREAERNQRTAKRRRRTTTAAGGS